MSFGTNRTKEQKETLKWRRDLETEMDNMQRTWKELQVAKDRVFAR